MLIIRHAEIRDLDDIFLLAEKSGVGLTSLPANKDTLALRLERIRKTLSGEVPRSEQGYLFVLEDTEQKRVVGLSAIEVAVGLSDSFYNYHIGKQVHSSKNLDVYKTLNTLFLSNDLTGSSELCTLFLDEAYRKNFNGKFLSKIRFMFIAAFKECFEKKLIAEMRGYSDETGRSPFWDAIGYKFFDMDFATADYLSGIGQKIFIAELMPRFPIYVDLLTPEVRNVIGQMHPHSQPAGHVLESEGMRFQGYVDIFDAGPTLEAEIYNLRAVKESQIVAVKIVEDSVTAQNETSTETPYMIANDDYQQYRAILLCQNISNGNLNLTHAQAEQLNIHAGQYVRALPLNTSEK